MWRDFENLFKDKVKELRDITSASLKSYITRNPDKVHNCSTPECEMVYVTSSEGKRFVCRQCGANICTQCHTTWHEGFDTCEAYKKRCSRDAELYKKSCSRDAELNQRMSKNHHSNYVKCSAPIEHEKTSGCQQVYCLVCLLVLCFAILIPMLWESIA